MYIPKTLLHTYTRLILIGDRKNIRRHAWKCYVTAFSFLNTSFISNRDDRIAFFSLSKNNLVA